MNRQEASDYLESGSAEETDCSEQGVSVSDEKIKPKSRKLRWIIPCLLAVLVLLGVGMLPYTRCQVAALLIERERYDQAEEILNSLGDYPPTKELRRAVWNFRCYEQAQDLFAQGEYESAAQIFQSLGNYRDAYTLKMESERRYEINELLKQADGQIKWAGISAGYRCLNNSSLRDQPEIVARRAELGERAKCELVECLPHMLTEQIKDYLYILQQENYQMKELREMVFQELESRILSHIELGDMKCAREILAEAEQELPQEAEGLREKLIEQCHMELDTGYYDDYTLDHISGFDASTTTADFASAAKYLLLSGKERIVMRPKGWLNANKVLPLLEDGCRLADMCLPEYQSIYCLYWNWNYYLDDNSLIDISLRREPQEAASIEEADKNLLAVQNYCEETVRRLNEQLLLSDTMSYKDRAAVIMAWVCNYLDYDDSKTIHDTYVAIQGEYGVCECYVAIYNRMCNLAGVPTFGQTGRTSNGEEGETHIWSLHLDEDGNVFYADPTWADNGLSGHGMTMETFSDLVTDHYMAFFLDTKYCWSENLWDSHEAKFTVEETLSYYAANTKE